MYVIFVTRIHWCTTTKRGRCNWRSAATEIDIKADSIERKMPEKWVSVKTKFSFGHSMFDGKTNHRSKLVSRLFDRTLLSCCPITFSDGKLSRSSFN